VNCAAPDLLRAASGLAALLLALAGAPQLPAALDWENTRLERTLQPLQTELEVTFAYRNPGPGRVAIRDLQTNCDCLAARASRTELAAGESGIVTARFTVGERVGRHERVITVATDDGAPPRKLVLQVEVPEIATLRPAALEWARGDPADERAAAVEVAPGLDLRFASVESTNEAFTVRLDEVAPGRTYRLAVRPRSTAAPANAALRLHGRTPDGRAVVVSAYANVR
jgi:hypothetical protein